MKKYTRYSFISLWVIIAFAFITLKLFKLTLFEKHSQNNSNSQKVQYMRGFIYSEDRTVLAISLKTYSIYANPKIFKSDLEKHYKEAFEKLGIKEKNVSKILNSKRNFLWVKRFIEIKTIKEYAKEGMFKLPGISYIKEYKRFYPHNETASQTLGFIGYDGDGLAGVEYTMNKTLKASNEFLPVWEKPNILGNDIILTINYPLQRAVEDEIKELYLEAKAKSVSAIVMEANTGNIVVMANYPSFNPNQFKDYHNYAIFKNNIVSHIDEPGSTFKPLILAYLLENDKVKEEDKFFCEKSVTLHGFSISDPIAYKWLTPRKIIQKSSNVGMALMAKDLSKKELYQILQSYFLTEKTGINLPGEEKGITRVPHKMTGRSRLSIPIGQEIGLTPLQLITAYTAIANHGKIMLPRIVDRIEYNGKLIKRFTPVVKRRVISEKTSDIVLSYMRDVVLKGTGRDANIPGVWLAGKTGTAQIFDFKSKTYSKVNTGFVGILKHQNGKNYIIYAVVRNPENKDASGGKMAAPLVKKITLKLLQLIN